MKQIVAQSSADELEMGLENLFAFSFTPGNLPSFMSGQGSPNARPSTEHGVQTHIANANDVQMQLASRFNTGIDLREEFGEMQAEAEISSKTVSDNLSTMPGRPTRAWSISTKLTAPKSIASQTTFIREPSSCDEDYFIIY